MADEYIQKSYDGGAETTTLTSAFVIGGTTLAVANGTTFPDGSSGPFVVVIDRGLASEEKMLIDTTSGANATTFNIQQVAYDGTSASAHSVGATVEHCLDAYSIEQANRYVNLQTTKGDLISRSSTTTVRLAAGTNNHVLMADSAQTTGLKYAQVGESSIADGAVTSGKLGAGSVTAAKISTAASGTTGQVLTANTSVTSGLEWLTPTTVPTGSITAYVGTTAPTGWLVCDGTAVSRTGDNAALFALVGTTYGAGNGSTTFNLPNLKSRVPIGLDSSDSDFNALGKTFGAKNVQLTSSQLPAHTHSVAGYTGNGEVNAPFDGLTSGMIHAHQAGNGIQANHTLGFGGGASTTAADGSTTFTGSAHRHYINMQATGGGSGSANGNNHNNVQPSLVVNYIIKL